MRTRGMVSKSERIARRRPAPRGHSSSLSCLDTYPLRLTLLPLPGPPFLPSSLPPCRLREVPLLENDPRQDPRAALRPVLLLRLRQARVGVRRVGH